MRPLIVASTPGLTVVIPPTGGFEICVAADCRITKLNLKCSSSSLLSRRRKEGIEVEAEGSGSLIIHQVSSVKQIDREDNIAPVQTRLVYHRQDLALPKFEYQGMH